MTNEITDKFEELISVVREIQSTLNKLKNFTEIKEFRLFKPHKVIIKFYDSLKTSSVEYYGFEIETRDNKLFFSALTIQNSFQLEIEIWPEFSVSNRDLFADIFMQANYIILKVFKEALEKLRQFLSYYSQRQELISTLSMLTS